MSFSASTLRTHNFNLQMMKRDSRVILAIMEQIEKEVLVAARKRLDLQEDAHTPRRPHFDPQFAANLLHPFFTQYNLK